MFIFEFFKNLWGRLMGNNAVRTGRNVRVLNKDGTINSDENMVLVDASQYHVVATLPPAFDFIGQLHIICVDATHGVEIVPGGSNVIHDKSNADFHAKGDALTFISDDQEKPGTWYIIGRYAALWYA